MSTNTFSDELYRVVLELCAAEEEFRYALESYRASVRNMEAMRHIVKQQLNKEDSDETIESVKKRINSYINEEA